MNTNNANNSSMNGQTGGHREGQMNNTPPNSSNNNQGMPNMHPEQERVSSQEGASASETESDRANRNEDEGVRGGNSSI
ncbi:MAG: hypothetical protein EOO16_13800 [Chitinophagaceae bacterium]|nr:MAG: hypothetical protein EOO16_13800 [Chitinophagaceae bacterium]